MDFGEHVCLKKFSMNTKGKQAKLFETKFCASVESFGEEFEGYDSDEQRQILEDAGLEDDFYDGEDGDGDYYNDYDDYQDHEGEEYDNY